jgi:hypothetical protein
MLMAVGVALERRSVKRNMASGGVKRRAARAPTTSRVMRAGCTTSLAHSTPSVTRRGRREGRPTDLRMGGGREGGGSKSGGRTKGGG